MRYELYTKVTAYNEYAYVYNISSNDVKIVFNFMELYPLSKHSKYIIIDNFTQNPVNYYHLGLESPPSSKEHYKIIYECKLAKEYYNHIKLKIYCDDLNYEEDDEIPFEAILKSAKNQAEQYFKDYTTKGFSQTNT